ncbi:unnamed protein product, partial [Sphacelaria rigidula]
ALFCDSGAPVAVVGGAVGGGDDRRRSQSENVERLSPGEGPTYTVSSTCAPEVNTRVLSASTAATTLLQEVGTTTRKGRVWHVGISTTEAWQRRPRGHTCGGDR